MNNLSIITINFNNALGLKRTIDSVISQTYSDYEWIMIDGGSTDDSIRQISRISEELKYYCSEKDRGIYDAMNKGISQCDSQWILFLNSGDYLTDPQSLEKVFEHNYNDEIGIIYGDWYDFNDNKREYRKPLPFYDNPYYLHHKGICHQSSFTRTSLAKKFLFDTNFKIAADYKMFMQIYKSGFKFEYIPYPISNFEIEVGTSQRNAKLAFKEDAIILGRYGTLRYWYHYIRKFIL